MFSFATQRLWFLPEVYGTGRETEGGDICSDPFSITNISFSITLVVFLRFVGDLQFFQKLEEKLQAKEAEKTEEEERSKVCH